MKEEIIIFTHNDLDALGCLLVLNKKFPEEQFDKTIYHTNYQNIPERVSAIINKCELSKPKLVIICDVSFSTSEDQLQVFYKYCDMNNIKMLYMDHHLYRDGFFEQFPKMTVIHDKNKCACKIVKDTFYPNDTESSLNKLISIIDVYDIWQDQHKWFDFSQLLNTYFWHSTDIGKSISQQVVEFESIDYQLPKDFLDVVNKIKAENSKTLLDLENSGLIHRNVDAKVSLFFSSNCFTEFMIKEHKLGQTFVINITNWGLIKVRVNQHNDVCLKVLENIRLMCTGTSDIGHAHAFTWKSDLNFNNDPKNSLMVEAKRVTSIIAECMNSNDGGRLQ